MPKHSSFNKIYDSFIKKYENGKELYYSWLNKHKLDDTKPMPMNMSAEAMNVEPVRLGNTGAVNLSELIFTASKPKIEIVAGKDGKKRAYISGTLMNTKFNSNHWRVAPIDGPTIASKIKGLPLKVFHGDDYTICGKGIEGYYDSSSEEINYRSIVRGAKEVAKFESGEWDEETMGVSPRANTWDRVECSICNNDVRQCEHTWKSTYDGSVCKITLYGSNISEHSLTSEPAYEKVGAGNISDVLMAAIQGGKMEKDDMKNLEAKIKEKDTLVAEKDKKIVEKDKVIAEKETEITNLNEKLVKAEESKEPEGGEDKDKEVTPPEGEDAKEDIEKKEKELEESNKNLEESNKNLKETKARLDKYVIAERKAGLEKVFDKEENKDLIASILDKDYSDVDFKAKILEFEAVKGFSASNEGTGSVPADGAKKAKFEEIWGSTKEEFLAEIVADSNIIGDK